MRQTPSNARCLPRPATFVVHQPARRARGPQRPRRRKNGRPTGARYRRVQRPQGPRPIDPEAHVRQRLHRLPGHPLAHPLRRDQPPPASCSSSSHPDVLADPRHAGQQRPLPQADQQQRLLGRAQRDHLLLVVLHPLLAGCSCLRQGQQGEPLQGQSQQCRQGDRVQVGQIAEKARSKRRPDEGVLREPQQAPAAVEYQSQQDRGGGETARDSSEAHDQVHAPREMRVAELPDQGVGQARQSRQVAQGVHQEQQQQQHAGELQ